MRKLNSTEKCIDENEIAAAKIHFPFKKHLYVIINKIANICLNLVDIDIDS